MKKFLLECLPVLLLGIAGIIATVVSVTVRTKMDTLEAELKKARMTKQADVTDLGSVEQMVRESSNLSTGNIISIEQGYWNGGVVNQPFVEGYYVKVFIPKKDVEEATRR